jgi:oxygen-independent coproporphyrinogen-3 oxidase
MHSDELSLYIHIPFCKSKCFYCDFLSFANKDKNTDLYFKALHREIGTFKTEKRIKSIFIGGGTPSSVPSRYITELMKMIQNRFDISETAEITIEANPGTVSEQKLLNYRNAGINRISFGAQAWQNDLLKSIGRIHNQEDIANSVAMAKTVGFDNINCDLMFSLPNQSCEDFLDSIKNVAAMGVQHISAYSLIIEENTPFYAMYDRGELKQPNDEEDRKMYHRGIELLKWLGYRQYEISNFALEGKECKHNLVYWYRGEYKGFGLGAASLLNEVRLKNTESFDDYIAGAYLLEKESLSVKDMQEEFMFLGLRCNKGIAESDFAANFGVSIDKVYGKQLSEFVSEGLIKRENGNVFLTERGFDISNMVFAEFIQ